MFSFMYDFSVAFISALALLKIRQFRNNCSGIKIDWEYPHACSYLRNANYVNSSCLRDLTDDFANNFISFFE